MSEEGFVRIRMAVSNREDVSVYHSSLVVVGWKRVKEGSLVGGNRVARLSVDGIHIRVRV